MKKYCALILTIIFLFSLGACSDVKDTTENQTETVDIDGQLLTVTFEPGTLSAGVIAADNGEYSFEYDGTGSLTITYPDGYVYTQKESNGGTMVPADYDATAVKSRGYIDGFSLSWGIERAMDNARGNRSNNSPSLPLSILLLSLGAWNLFAPKSAWWLARGWWYKNAEPSELALGLYRVAGMLLIFVGVICAIALL